MVLQTLKEEIERLNERGSGFAAVVRLGSGEPRERKRGALEALSRYLVKGDGSEFGIILGGKILRAVNLYWRQIRTRCLCRDAH